MSKEVIPKIKEVLRAIDYFLLDRCIQPLADMLSDIFGVTSWSFGVNLQLGSILFQAVATIMPIILEGSSFAKSFDGALSLLLSIVLFIVMGRYIVLIRPDRINPLRELFWGVRVISIGFFLYDLYKAYCSSMPVSLWGYLDKFSAILFILSIYFMSCYQKPPREKTFRKFSFNHEG